MRAKGGAPDLLWAVYRRLGLVVLAVLILGLATSWFVIWALAELADEVAEGESRRFDGAALLAIRDLTPAYLEGPMRLVTALGYYAFVIPAMLLAAGLLLRYRRRLSALLLLVATGGSVLLTTALKALFERARPEIVETGYTASFYSFPSGHATVAAGFYGTLALILAYNLRGAARWAAVVVGTILVLLIGFSRLYLGVHYPTDVLAGYLSALVWISTVGTVLLVLHILRRGER